MITNRQADVLLHASSNGRYVTDEEDVIQMGRDGLLFDHGPQRVAGGAHYLVTTVAGRAALNEWKAAQPKPKIVKRRESLAFKAWRDYKAYGDSRITFSEFWKNLWPELKHGAYKSYCV